MILEIRVIFSMCCVVKCSNYASIILYRSRDKVWVKTRIDQAISDYILAYKPGITIQNSLINTYFNFKEISDF
jgi:hypothetical protein